MYGERHPVLSLLFLSMATTVHCIGGSIKKKSLTSIQVKMYSCIDLWLGMFLDYYQRVTSNLKATAGYRRWPPSCAVCWQSKVLGRKITQPVR